MKKILIVEDDQLVATAYRKWFKDAGWAVEWAPDGVEGIKAVGAAKPDVVLLDLLMPRLDGIDVLKYIRAHPDLRYLPVVVFSNSYMTNLIENAWRAGADQCLMKGSTTPQSLLDSIGKAMQKSEARKTVENASPIPILVAPSGPGPRFVAPIAIEPRRPTRAPTGPPIVLAPPVEPLAYLSARPFAPPPVAQPPVSAVPGPVPAPDLLPGAVSAVSPLATVDLGQDTAHLSAAVVAGPAQVQSADPEFQAQIRQLFVADAMAKLESVRAAAQALGRSAPEIVSTARLAALFRTVHSMTGNAAFAGCAAIANYSSAFEAFLQDLQQKPRFFNASTLRTIQGGIEFLALLFQHALSEEPPELARRILVVDEDPMSGQAIALTLEKAGLRTHLVGDPIEAMALGSTESFDLIVMTVDLPGMTGFELCGQLQTLPGCAAAPVLFVSASEQFSLHVHSPALGGNDIIARPFLIIELTLKTMTLLESHRFRTHFASAA